MKSGAPFKQVWTTRAAAILYLSKKWKSFIVRIVVPGRERSERTRNLEIPGLRFAHPGMTANSQSANMTDNEIDSAWSLSVAGFASATLIHAKIRTEGR